MSDELQRQSALMTRVSRWRFTRIRNRLPEVVLGLACLITIVRVMDTLMHAPQARPEGRAQVMIGDRILTSEVNWSSADRSLFLFLFSLCDYCEDSLPLYKTLADTVRATPGIQLVVGGQEPERILRPWLKGAGIEPDQIVQVATPKDIGIPYAPTLMIVDSTGRVTDVAARFLTDAEGEHVLQRVRQGPDTGPFNIKSHVQLISPDTFEVMRAAGSTIMVESPADAERQMRAFDVVGHEAVRVVIDCRGQPDSTCLSKGKDVGAHLPAGVYAVVNR
jgi:hypothetical protein